MERNSKDSPLVNCSLVVLLLWTAVATQYSAPGLAYELDTGYFSFRNTYTEFQFSQTLRYENFSGIVTRFISQTWLPTDKFPPESEEVKLFLSTAKNETKKRDWYWNKQFLDYVTDDLNNLLEGNFSEITLQENQLTAEIVNVSSTVFIVISLPRPTRTNFDPSLAGISFNVTYLPRSMSHYVSENVTSEDWENLERWESTASKLETEIQARWYVANFTITQGGICLGYHITNPFLEPILGLVVLAVISLTSYKKRKRH